MVQEEVSEKIVSLSVNCTRMTANTLKSALRALLARIEKQNNAPYQMETEGEALPRGKQSLKSMMDEGSELTNIEVTDKNIRSFDRVARKYGIDYSLKKDKSTVPPRYLVFFKAKDVDVMTAAFKEYTGVARKRVKKPSVRKKLTQMLSRAKNMEREKTRGLDRGQTR